MNHNTIKEQLTAERDSLKDRLQSVEMEIKRLSLLESLREVSEGTSLGDGSVVVYKKGDYAILAAPYDTEMLCSWDEIPNSYANKLEERGFCKEDWFVPDLALLKLAFKNAFQDFRLAAYWTREEASPEAAWCFHANGGGEYVGSKVATARVRAFKAVFF